MSLGDWARRRVDARADGRERYLDMTPAQRADALPEVMRAASNEPELVRQFARGWLDEYVRGSKNARRF